MQNRSVRSWPKEWVLLAAVAGLFTAGRLLPYFPWRLPVCGWRMLTGLPCPLCGSTRCAIAWSHGRVAEAFALNPLAAIAGLALLLWLALKLCDWCCSRQWSERIWQGAQRKPWPSVLLVAALVNWIYLMLRLPK